MDDKSSRAQRRHLSSIKEANRRGNINTKKARMKETSDDEDDYIVINEPFDSVMSREPTEYGIYREIDDEIALADSAMEHEEFESYREHTERALDLTRKLMVRGNHGNAV